MVATDRFGDTLFLLCVTLFYPSYQGFRVAKGDQNSPPKRLPWCPLYAVRTTSPVQGPNPSLCLRLPQTETPPVRTPSPKAGLRVVEMGAPGQPRGAAIEAVHLEEMGISRECGSESQ